jgi:hypothetical protein
MPRGQDSNHELVWSSASVERLDAHLHAAEMTKSELYLEALPMFTQGLVSLPNHPRLIRELRLLERRTSRQGRDIVDHGRAGSDDYINAVAGALRMLDRRFTLMDLPDDNEEPKPPKQWEHADAMQEYMRRLQ